MDSLKGSLLDRMIVELVVLVDWGGDEAEADELVEGGDKLAACCLPCSDR